MTTQGRHHRRVLGALLVVSVLLAACAGTADPGAVADVADERTAPTRAGRTVLATPPPPVPPAPRRSRPMARRRVRRLADVPEAVVRVIAYGDHLAPHDGVRYASMSGSGFVVHSDGTAVTNAHVVAGADRVTADTAGETTGTPARILGVDPCNDLAVIRLDGSGHRWLRWSPVRDGRLVPVTSFGHPGGQIGVHRQRGSVFWVASGAPNPLDDIESMLELDFTSASGMSGGAVVDRRHVGVLGVVSAADDHETFAVPATVAQPAVDRMVAAHHPADLGVIGNALRGDVAPIAGIAVAHVVPGSRAARSGLRRGDIITQVDGTRVGADGTMSAYCDALRTHNHGDPVLVEVARPSTERLLTGAVGHGRLRRTGPLDVVDAQLLPVYETAVHAPYRYRRRRDATSRLRAVLPVEWDEIVRTPMRAGSGRRLPALRASTDRGGPRKRLGSPGTTIVMAARRGAFTLDTLPADLGYGDIAQRCDPEGRAPVRTPRFSGTVQVYAWCGGPGTVIAMTLDATRVRASVAVVTIVRSPRDLEALDRLVDTLAITRRR
jgi:serine protease Do